MMLPLLRQAWTAFKPPGLGRGGRGAQPSPHHPLANDKEKIMKCKPRSLGFRVLKDDKDLQTNKDAGQFMNNHESC